MTLRLDPNDPTRTKIQYRKQNCVEGMPRILFVAEKPDVYGNQIVILNGNGVIGVRDIEGRFSKEAEDLLDIVNAPPDAEELLERMAAILTKYRTFMPTDADKEAKCLIEDYAAWKASR